MLNLIRNILFHLVEEDMVTTYIFYGKITIGVCVCEREVIHTFAYFPLAN